LRILVIFEEKPVAAVCVIVLCLQLKLVAKQCEILMKMHSLFCCWLIGVGVRLAD